MSSIAEATGISEDELLVDPDLKKAVDVVRHYPVRTRILPQEDRQAAVVKGRLRCQ